MKYKFYDTCSLLEKASNLWTAPDEQLVVSSITLEELENIKTSVNKDANIKYAARKLVKELYDNYDKIEIVFWTDNFITNYVFDNRFKITNDLKIVLCALDFFISKDEKDCYFITNDICCKTFAKFFLPSGITIEDYRDEPYDYLGYKEVQMEDDEMAYFYNNLEENKYGLITNEYLIVKDKDGNIVDKMCWTGERFRPVQYYTFSSSWFGDVKPFKGDIYQVFAFDSLMNNKITMLKGRAGSGKAQPVSTLIPTKTGKIKLGELKLGDKILDRFGNETMVLAIYEQGLKENFKITFSDGRVAYCNDEHLWSCYTSKGHLKNFTVKEMNKIGLQTKSGAWRFQVPLNKPVQYPEKNYQIDPYIMGAFLGDGCCCEKPLTISSNDEEIVKEVSRLLGPGTTYRRESSHNYNWCFYLPEEKKHKLKNNAWVLRYHTKDIFGKYESNIMCKSYEKSIPEEYKYGSIAQRLSLIQGLMDTDGSIDNSEKGRARFTSCSLKLILDIQEICWSLGMTANFSEDHREKYTNGVCYNLTISCPKEYKPFLFRLKRKKDIALAHVDNGKKQQRYDRITITKIEKMPHLEEMRCILVDNPEHLYLTEDFIVTHNTWISLSFLLHKLEKGKIDKIIIFCNPVATNNSAKLGFYPGTKNDKLLDSQIGNLLSAKLGSQMAVQHLIDDEKLVLVPLADIRGYDTSGMNAGVYITEAQNMDTELMKLALQRIGEDCICIIDGDFNAQVDMVEYAGANNGMRRASKVLRGNDIYGEITLNTIHRSKIAELAEQI